MSINLHIRLNHSYCYVLIYFSISSSTASPRYFIRSPTLWNTESLRSSIKNDQSVERIRIQPYCRHSHNHSLTCNRPFQHTKSRPAPSSIWGVFCHHGAFSRSHRLPRLWHSHGHNRSVGHDPSCSLCCTSLQR